MRAAYDDDQAAWDILGLAGLALGPRQIDRFLAAQHSMPQRSTARRAIAAIARSTYFSGRR
jgi:hypothetical protein